MPTTDMKLDEPQIQSLRTEITNELGEQAVLYGNGWFNALREGHTGIGRNGSGCEEVRYRCCAQLWPESHTGWEANFERFLHTAEEMLDRLKRGQ